MTDPYYQDDYVTLYHGDCLKQLAWLAADVLVTDPPYGMGHTSRTGAYKGKGSYVADPQAVIGDHDTSIRDAILSLWKPRPRIVFGTWRIPRPEPVDHRLIWHKEGQMPGPLNAPFMLQDEEIYVTGKGFRSSSPPQRSVIRTDEHRSLAVRKSGHPTSKPVQLMTLLIDRCPPGIISDPCFGSGPTLIAAKSLGRTAIGVELDERYCEIAANCLSQDVFDFGGGS